MATILVFKTEGRAPDVGARQGARRQARVAAQIIIFPGVRYERALDPGPSAGPATSMTVRQRDRLELIEC